MGKRDPLADAASRFSNALRLYAEASLHTKRLFAADPEEAIDNLDRAFDGLLSALHSLYDAMCKRAWTWADWYGQGDTAATIVVRNARHHNLDSLFQSWNSLMLKQGQLEQMTGAAFLLVGYTLVADEGMVSEYYVPWDDFRAMLDLPTTTTKLREVSRLRSLLDTECGFDSIRHHASAERFPLPQVFVNLIPILMNAATRVFAALRDAAESAVGYDWKVYTDHFVASPLADLQQPTFKVIRAPAY